ncbi:unnamed protein product, partial [marine sediment metagenome]
MVQQPRKESCPIIGRPRESPAKAVWETIWRRSIVFNPTRNRSDRGKLYRKVTVADATGDHT